MRDADNPVGRRIGAGQDQAAIWIEPVEINGRRRGLDNTAEGFLRLPQRLLNPLVLGDILEETKDLVVGQVRLADDMDTAQIAFGRDDFQFLVKGFALLDRALHDPFDDRPGCRRVEVEALLHRRPLARIDLVDMIDHFRPNLFFSLNVEFPAARLPDLFGLGKQALAFLQRRLGQLALGDLQRQHHAAQNPSLRILDRQDVGQIVVPFVFRGDVLLRLSGQCGLIEQCQPFGTLARQDFPKRLAHHLLLGKAKRRQQVAFDQGVAQVMVEQENRCVRQVLGQQAILPNA